MQARREPHAPKYSEYVAAEARRWNEARGNTGNALLQQAELFDKKMQPST